MTPFAPLRYGTVRHGEEQYGQAHEASVTVQAATPSATPMGWKRDLVLVVPTGTQYLAAPRSDASVLQMVS